MSNPTQTLESPGIVTLRARGARAEASYCQALLRRALNRVMAEALGYDVARWEREHAGILEAVPCQEIGREEIDPSTWRP